MSIITLETAVMECYSNKKFMTEYNRVNGTNLAEDDTRSPIEKLIDNATSFTLSEREINDLKEFIKFVDVVVWQEVYNTGKKECLN